MPYTVTWRDGRWVSESPPTRCAITSPETARGVLMTLPWPVDREAAFMLLLDKKHRLIEAEMVSVGAIDHTFMSPREIMRGALLGNAAALVVAHNHPSGDVYPSQDDEAVTRRLRAAGEIVGVELLDHLIVTGGEGPWTSLARRGLL